MKKQHETIIQVQESVDEGDNESVDSFNNRTIKQHKMYQRPKASKMTLCEKRASMKLIAGIRVKLDLEDSVVLLDAVKPGICV